MKRLERNIIVLGAGFGGILTAKKLAKRLKKQEDVKITLIDKNPYHTVLTQIQEVAAARVEAESVRVSLQKIFRGRRVNVVLDTIETADYAQKTLHGKNGEYSYDFLVLATGSRPAFFGTPGAEEHAFRLWSLEDAIRLREHVTQMFREAAAVADPEKKRALLTFYVVGAGFTGVEMAGELAEWIPFLCEEFEIDRSLVNLVDVDMLDRVVPIFPEKLSGKADRRLHKMGVTTVLRKGVCAVGEDFIELKEKDGNVCTRFNTHTVIWTAGVQGSEFAANSKELTQVGRARLQTDQYLRAAGQDSVFVVGDNVFYVPEGQQRPVPQMVENAEDSAETVAHNIVTAVTGEGEPETYRPKFHGAMLSVGGRYGVAYVGSEKSKISLASFFAMFVKHFVYVIYFIQILGWNKVFGYVKHEFFTVRHRRSFLGGHFSNRTPSFLLVPLRIFLGAFWIYEGVQKIMQGWLSSPKLASYFQSASNVFNSVLTGKTSGDATTSATTAATAAHAAAPAVAKLAAVAKTAADATSSATTAASGAGGAHAAAGSLLFNWDCLGLFHVILIQTSDIAVKIQVGVMDWFTSTFITSSSGSQMFFQYFIVFLELLIGALLVVGLFTFASSVVSLGLQAMFVASTGMYLSTWWMVFASIATLIGAGHIFGLDYYVIPTLKKHWKKVRWVGKLYIYND